MEKEVLKSFFDRKIKIHDSVKRIAWAIETRPTAEFYFSAKKAFQYLFFHLFLHPESESDVRMAVRSLVFEIYDLLARGVIFPDHP